MFEWIEKRVLTTLLRRGEAVEAGWYDLGRTAAAEAAEINATLQRLRVGAVVNTDRVIASPTGNFIRYPLRTYGKIADINSVVGDLEMAVSMRRGLETKIHLRRPMLALELPFPLETRVLTWESAQKRLGELQPFQALLGMDYTADIPKPAILDFGSKIIASALIAGATGSGKTTLIANMISSLCHSTSPQQLQIVFCDPKFDDDYFALAGLPHVTMVNEPADCIRAIHAVYEELERRKRTPSTSRLILFVDEYADLKNSQEDGGLELGRRMAQITAVGRSKGVHVILATQKPTTEIVDTVAKGNLTVRIGGMVMTPKESEIAMGRGGIGCDTLEGKGAFYAVLGGGRIIRTQTYLLDGESLERAVERAAARWVGVEPLRIEMAEVQIKPAPATNDDAIDAAMIQQVMEIIDYDEIFDEDGEVRRGMRAALLRLLFDEGTQDKGTPGRTVTRLLDKLRYLEWA